MQLLGLLLFTFALPGDCARGSKPNVAKLYKKCRNAKCNDQCSNQRQHTTACTNCAHLNGCEMPKMMAKMIQCAQNECKDKCVDIGLHGQACKECRKSGICRPNKKKNPSQKNIRQPISLLKQYITGKRNKPVKINTGTKAQLRCAMGMCTAQCLLKQSTEVTVECKDCIEQSCPLTDASNSCIAAENNVDNKQYNFCSTVTNCANDVLTGATFVDQLNCAESNFCCTWEI